MSGNGGIISSHISSGDGGSIGSSVVLSVGVKSMISCYSAT